MEENLSKIETKSISARLPVDVIETLNRWMEESGQSMAQCITTCIRTSAEAEKCITQPVLSEKSVLQSEDVIQDRPQSVIQLPYPKTRDLLADSLTGLILESGLNDREIISALGVARARVYKTTPEFQVAWAERRKVGIVGVYDDEKALAEQLLNQQPVDRPRGAREKGE